jgi:hypothetical protein
MKKSLWSLSIVALISLISCGGGEKAKELLKRMLNLVGIPQTMVVNICQDENGDGLCGLTELHAKITINKGDSADAIWHKITNTEDGRYLLETYDPTLPLLLELKDSSSQYYTDKFTIPFDGLAPQEEEKDLSILQAMVDADYLTSQEIEGIKEINNKDMFYSALLKDFEINLNTLNQQDLSSPRAVMANIKEMAEELRDAGIADILPSKIDDCQDNSCVEETIAETVIDENESNTIKEEETRNTKELLAGKTFYMVANEEEENKGWVLFEVSINSDATKMIGKDDSSDITITGNRITFNDDTDGSYTMVTPMADYILFDDRNADGSKDGSGHYAFTDKAEAEAFLDSKTGGGASIDTFTFPSKYYGEIHLDHEYYDGEEHNQFEAEMFSFSADKQFTFSELIFDGTSFVLDDNDNDNEEFVFKDGAWVKKSDTVTTVISDDNKVVTLDDTYRLTFESIKDIEGESRKITNSDISVVMPKGAQEIKIGLEILKEKYTIDDNKDYQSFEELLTHQCGTRYFRDAKENSGIEGIAFACNQENQTSGTLVGVKSDGELVTSNVGTWKIENLPNSTVKWLLITIDKKYNKYTDYPFFAIKDGSVWEGWYDTVGKKDPMIRYNQKAFDAFSSEIKNTYR